MTRDLATERDLTILRSFKQPESPAGVVDGRRAALKRPGWRAQPWTEQLVIEPHDFLCRSVRATARLVGPAIVASSMHDHELVALCM